MKRDKATCAVEGCERGGRLRRGWCDMHYRRWRTKGSPGSAAPLIATGPPQHGTENMYGNHGCRCDECQLAHAVYTTERNHRLGIHRPRELVFAERRAEALARDNHGTETRYTFGCRCDACRVEASRQRRERRRRAVA